MLIHVPNDKTPRKGTIRNNGQAFGNAADRGCQQILWQATTDQLIPSTAALHTDEARFELISSVSVPQVYFDKALRRIVRHAGLAVCQMKIAVTTTMTREARGPDQAAPRREIQIRPGRGGRIWRGRPEASDPDQAATRQ
jgi:hypothetical protein